MCYIPRTYFSRIDLMSDNTMKTGLSRGNIFYYSISIPVVRCEWARKKRGAKFKQQIHGWCSIRKSIGYAPIGWTRLFHFSRCVVLVCWSSPLTKRTHTTAHTRRVSKMFMLKAADSTYRANICVVWYNQTCHISVLPRMGMAKAWCVLAVEAWRYD